MSVTNTMHAERQVDTVYQDPIDVIWTTTAKRCGMNVVRDNEVFASWDGHSTLRIGDSGSLDSDDHLGQMILHELCHALVEGPDGLDRPDWGLQIDDPKDRVREHACLRLQACLADIVGLRSFFAATTEFRCYYDRIGMDPLDENESSTYVDRDPAIELARVGAERATQGPWSSAIRDALFATRKVVDATCDFADANAIWKHAPSNSTDC